MGEAMNEGDVVTSEKSYAGKGLDRQVIVQAALESIDRHGSQGLTMRGLGQELSVEAMSLYRYVSGREDLLEAVIAELLDDIRPHMDELLARTWQGYLQSLSHAVRQIAIEHPAAFPLVATRHPAAPWLRPPFAAWNSSRVLSTDASDSTMSVVRPPGITSSYSVPCESSVRGARRQRRRAVG